MKMAGMGAGLSNITALRQLLYFVGIFNVLLQGHGHGGSLRCGGFDVGDESCLPDGLRRCRPETGDLGVVLFEIGEKVCLKIDLIFLSILN